jgi:hypothetical protein
VSLPYVYLPRPAERITVSRDGEDHCLLAVFADGASVVRVLPDEVPGVAAGIATAMHEAAGLPAPVILERPAATFRDGVNRAGNIEVGRLGGRVTVGLYGIQPEEIGPAEARRLAALIAVRAEEARGDEPDPAEVEELAGAIRTAHHPDSGRPGDGDRTAARAALRWFADKQQRGDEAR